MTSLTNTRLNITPPIDLLVDAFIERGEGRRRAPMDMLRFRRHPLLEGGLEGGGGNFESNIVGTQHTGNDRTLLWQTGFHPVRDTILRSCVKNYFFECLTSILEKLSYRRYHALVYEKSQSFPPSLMALTASSPGSEYM
jgi:hypothetical protein